MKKSSLVAAASAATLALTLTACSGPGDAARDLAQAWLNGDSSVQCLGQPSPWSSYELGGSQMYETTEDGELWTVGISGVRNMAPVGAGYVLVEIREDGQSCVKWSQP